jgi:hypothetical protein
MGRRAFTWALSIPLILVSVLVGHALAYEATGLEPGAMHEYLDHAPQVLAVLVLAALIALAIDRRSTRLATAPFAGLGIAVFSIQEHVERYAHTGELPFLVTDRTFLLGLVLQVPVGVLCVWIARRLVSAARALLRARPRRTFGIEAPPVSWAFAGTSHRVRLPVATLGRGPPTLHRP